MGTPRPGSRLPASSSPASQRSWSSADTSRTIRSALARRAADATPATSPAPAATAWLPTIRAPKWRSSSDHATRARSAVPSASSACTTYQRRNPERTYQPARPSTYIAPLGSTWKVSGSHASLRSASLGEPTLRKGIPRSVDHRASSSATPGPKPPMMANASRSFTSDVAALRAASGSFACAIATSKSRSNISALKANSNATISAPCCADTATARSRAVPTTGSGRTRPITSRWAEALPTNAHHEDPSEGAHPRAAHACRCRLARHPVRTPFRWRAPRRPTRPRGASSGDVCPVRWNHVRCNAPQVSER